MSIPFFTTFSPLELEHRLPLQAALQTHPPDISELTFTNLYAWREWYGFELAAWPNSDAFLLRATRPEGQAYFYPLSTQPAPPIMLELKAAMPQIRFIRVPQSILSELGDLTGWQITEDASNADYLYAYEDLRLLAGRKYDGKRNHIKRFSAEHPFTYQPLAPGLIQKLLDFEAFWCEARECGETPSLDHERRAIHAMLEHWQAFGLLGGALVTEDKIVAIILAEPLNPTTLVIHILKALPDFPGAIPTLLQHFLEIHRGKFQWVNMEQDLGIEGLRRSKQSYHPARMVRKYNLTG
jgi:hypothetical protein